MKLEEYCYENFRDPSFLKGKRWLITGATSGVGLALARALNRLGATTVLVGRNDQKISQTLSHLPFSENALPLVGDLGTSGGIKALSDQVAALGAFDGLAACAGRVKLGPDQNENGESELWNTNFLSAVRLTKTVLDLSVGRPDPTIAWVTGDNNSFLRSRIVLPPAPNASLFSALEIAKAKVLLAKIWNSHRGKETIRTFHPGLVRSHLAQNLPRPFRWLGQLVVNFFPSESPLSVHAVLSPNWIRQKVTESENESKNLLRFVEKSLGQKLLL